MSYPLQRHTLAAGVHLSSIQDPKFKHNRLSVNMILPLEKEKLSERAIVPFLLRKGTQDCPDFTKLNERLYDLYGASLFAEVSKYGAYQILTIAISSIDSRFALEGEDMVKACAQLLCEILLRPHWENGAFLPEDLKSEKQYLIDSIQAEINDKRSYAVSQCLQTMCQGEPFALRKYGTQQQVEAITPQAAAKSYREMLRIAQIEIMFVGAGSPDSARDIFAQALSSVERSPLSMTHPTPKAPKEVPAERTERMDLSQSKLVLGFKGGSVGSGREACAMRLMSALYGGTPFSLLFQNVREKLSLCYYCAARYDRSTGILMVDSGVEGPNREKAQEEILRQLAQVQEGNFTEEEFQNTKLSLDTAFKATTDSLEAIESWYLTQILWDSDLSPDEDAQLTREITKEEVVAAAKSLTLDTLYFLTGKEA